MLQSPASIAGLMLTGRALISDLHDDTLRAMPGPGVSKRAARLGGGGMVM